VDVLGKPFHVNTDQVIADFQVHVAAVAFA